MTIFTDSMHSGECRSCRAQVIWATTYPNNKSVPIDVGHKITPTELINISHVDTSASHFSTCPDAKRWNKR